MNRVDVSAFDDTELGAEVRALYANGARLVTLVDASEPDTRAMTWVDGTHGLWRMRCPQEHSWLSAMAGPLGHRGPVQDCCPTCELPGELVDG